MAYRCHSHLNSYPINVCLVNVLASYAVSFLSTSFVTTVTVWLEILTVTLIWYINGNQTTKLTSTNIKCRSVCVRNAVWWDKFNFLKRIPLWCPTMVPLSTMHTPEESVKIGKCPAENGLAQAVWNFSKPPDFKTTNLKFASLLTVSNVSSTNICSLMIFTKFWQ